VDEPREHLVWVFAVSSLYRELCGHVRNLGASSGVLGIGAVSPELGLFLILVN
jgi:hypothetical protein